MRDGGDPNAVCHFNVKHDEGESFHEVLAEAAVFVRRPGLRAPLDCPHRSLYVGLEIEPQALGRIAPWTSFLSPNFLMREISVVGFSPNNSAVPPGP